MFAKLKKGDVLSETQFYKVEKTSATQAQLINDNGESIVVDKAYVDSLLQSADQFTTEEKMTRTEVAAKFIASSNVAVTINFNKQVKEADVTEEIQKAYESSTPKEFTTKMKKTVKTALEGEPRTMRGRHYAHVNEFGRVNFVDMDEKKVAGKDYDPRTRQVDPRTINWFICRGVKYSVK